MALKNATLNGSTDIQWYYKWLAINVQDNYRMFPYNNRTLTFSDMDGWKYTWEPAGSHDGTTVKATALYDGVHPTFPAFYAAGHYRQQLTDSGITLTNGMESKDWYLPSNGEIVYIATEFGRCNQTELMTNVQFVHWKAEFAFSALRQVEGDLVMFNTVSSTEMEYSIFREVGYVSFFTLWINWYLNGGGKESPFKVSPFIIYKGLSIII